MKIRPHLSLRWVLAAALLPLALAALFVLAMQVYGLVRYDPDYFSATYAERYDTPGAVARALERALQSGDRALLAELQGLRWPAAFEANPDMIFVMLWERDERYISYMYFDVRTHHRHMHYVEQVKGRWVVSPSDPYYYLHSGRWLRVFGPLAVVWWLLEIVVILAAWLFRTSARLRERMYGG